MTPEPISHEVLVAAPPERAFELFATRLGAKARKHCAQA
jgi:hypothetical protein